MVIVVNYKDYVKSCWTVEFVCFILFFAHCLANPVSDKTVRTETSNNRLVRWTVQKPSRSTAQMRPAMHSILGNVPE